MNENHQIPEHRMPVRPSTGSLNHCHRARSWFRNADAVLVRQPGSHGVKGYARSNLSAMPLETPHHERELTTALSILDAVVMAPALMISLYISLLGILGVLLKWE